MCDESICPLNFPDIFEKIIVFLPAKNLTKLMETCKLFRDWIGTSTVWRIFDQGSSLANMKGTSVEILFKSFSEIEFGKKYYVSLPEHFGDDYCLFIMRYYFRENKQNSWNLYSLIMMPEYIEGICKVRGFIKNNGDAEHYQAWKKMITKVVPNTKGKSSEEIEKIQKILRAIYVSPYFYNTTTRTIQISDVKTNCLFGPRFYSESSWFNCEFEIAEELCSYSDSGIWDEILSSEKFSERLFEIAEYLKINFDLFKKIMTALIGKDYSGF